MALNRYPAYRSGIMIPFLLLCLSSILLTSVVFGKIKQLRVVVTSDLHGWMSTAQIFPGRKRKGLLHIRDGITRIRSEDHEMILLDAGDLLQGSPLADYIQRTRSTPADDDPFFRIINSMGYDAVVVGNHDLGINPLFEKFYKPLSSFPWLAANLLRNRKLVFKPYILLKRCELNIAVLGITTPGSQMWLGTDQLNGLVFEPISESAERWLNHIESQEKPDLIIALFHSGVYPLRDDENSKLNRISVANAVEKTLGQVNGFDLVIAGHDHRLSPYRDGMAVRHVMGTPVVEGGAMGEAFMDLKLAVADVDNEWRIVDIDVTVNRASQGKRIEQAYISRLPVDYQDYLQQELPYRIIGADRQQAAQCINLLNAMAQDEPVIAGTMLPRLALPPLRKLIGKRLTRLELFKWIRYDNKTVVVRLNRREIHLLEHPAPESGRRRIPGNRKLYSYFKQPLSKMDDRDWQLKWQDYDRIYPVKISDYHFNGGGGIIPQLFLSKEEVRVYSLISIREQLFNYLSQRPGLPPECRFLHPE